MNGAVVLCDMHIDRPWPKCIGQQCVRIPELCLRVTRLQQRLLGRIVSKQIQLCVRKISLEAEIFWHPDAFQNLQH